MYLKYAVSALLATVVLARPSNWNDDGWDDDTPDCPDTPDNCLTDSDAADIITVYETLISRKITGAEFNETADSILAPTFFTQSNSLNAEIRKPLEAVSIPSPEAFKAIFSVQPPSQGTATLDLFHSCNKIAWRWMGTSPEGLPVRGLTMMDIEDGKIAATFLEYFRPALYNCTV